MKNKNVMPKMSRLKLDFVLEEINKNKFKLAINNFKKLKIFYQKLILKINKITNKKK